MSSSTEIIYGMGFKTTSLSFKTIMEFTKKHNACFKNILYFDKIAKLLSDMDLSLIPDEFNPSIDEADNQLLELISALKEYTETHCCLNSDVCASRNFANIIADIFNTENLGIQLEFQEAQPETCEGEPSILLSMNMPWLMTKREKELTEDSFVKLLEPYILELGLSISDIDNLKIEYYG